MHEPEVLRPNGKFCVCDCSAAPCRSAGYFPSQDAFYIPTVGHEMVLNTPNLLSAEMKKRVCKKKCKSGLYLYPWHFFPDHRVHGEDGLW